jgi:lipoyl-dependent peroxiredoxin
MPIATRSAEVTWDGSLAHGRETSPEELIAAAHATCFTMALALVLGEAGTPPERLTTSADCILAEVDGAPRITDITLGVRADVESLDEGAFNDAVAQAAALCPVSNALRDNVAISMDAALASHSIAE